jgi:hypothetical protein
MDLKLGSNLFSPWLITTQDDLTLWTDKCPAVNGITLNDSDVPCEGLWHGEYG